MPRMRVSSLAGPGSDCSLMRQWSSSCYLQPGPTEDMLLTLPSSINGRCCGMRRHTRVGYSRRHGGPASLRKKLCCTNGFDYTSHAGFGTSGPRDHLTCATSATSLTLTAWTRTNAEAILSTKLCLGKRGRLWRTRFSSTRPRRHYRRRCMQVSRRALHRKWRQAVQQRFSDWRGR